MLHLTEFCYPALHEFAELAARPLAFQTRRTFISSRIAACCLAHRWVRRSITINAARQPVLCASQQ